MSPIATLRAASRRIAHDVATQRRDESAEHAPPYRGHRPVAAAPSPAPHTNRKATQ